MQMGLTTGTIIFSRLSSRRLPNKSLIEINGIPLIQHVINISKKINSNYHIIATSNRPEDEAFVEIANRNQIEIVSGDLENVAQRTIDCIQKYNLDYFIRINGDSPIIPINLINDKLKHEQALNEYDIVTNIFPRSFPYGYSVEIIKSLTFVEHFRYFLPEQREHITKYFYDNHSKFKIQNIHNDIPIKEKTELTVDDENSLKYIQNVFKMFPDIQTYSLSEILKSCQIIDK